MTEPLIAVDSHQREPNFCVHGTVLQDRRGRRMRRKSEKKDEKLLGWCLEHSQTSIHLLVRDPPKKTKQKIIIIIIIMIIMIKKISKINFHFKN